MAYTFFNISGSKQRSVVCGSATMLFAFFGCVEVRKPQASLDDINQIKRLEAKLAQAKSNAASSDGLGESTDSEQEVTSKAKAVTQKKVLVAKNKVAEDSLLEEQSDTAKDADMESKVLQETKEGKEKGSLPSEVLKSEKKKGEEKRLPPLNKVTQSTFEQWLQCCPDDRHQSYKEIRLKNLSLKKSFSVLSNFASPSENDRAACFQCFLEFFSVVKNIHSLISSHCCMGKIECMDCRVLNLCFKGSLESMQPVFCKHLFQNFVNRDHAWQVINGFKDLFALAKLFNVWADDFKLAQFSENLAHILNDVHDCSKSEKPGNSGEDKIDPSWICNMQANIREALIQAHNGLRALSLAYLAACSGNDGERSVQLNNFNEASKGLQRNQSAIHKCRDQFIK